MESVNVKKILDAYFEGTTSLEEEKRLQDYFNSEKVADDLVQYQPIFAGLKVAKEERSSKAFTLPESKPKTIKTWWYSAAAILVVAFGVGSFYFSQPHYSQEEKEALAAFEKSKNAMMLLSENLNRGAEQLTFVEQFTITKEKIFE
ncbi:hypothetical protein [Aequorivita antarctica]|uniref:Uncharacterized protein n=1 Tax=Aequorivita antarctica TaxID=153266 RepID=A0A5C6Z239_9FLAO|nr:hypothetical protein [Aequorivita antarctica]TXD73441.1 hypothetical protein ESU54_06665 [Aequorivita antarctica]SRX76339.1 hypothetical protein AEQU3_03339 [Aequorivita antarctica]